jgi:hypothetical protein
MSIPKEQIQFPPIRILFSISLIIAFSLLAPAQKANGQSGHQCLVGTRQPSLWPFDYTSPWNTPIGTGAIYGEVNNPITQSIQLSHINFNTTSWSISVVQASNNDPLSTVSLGNGSNITIHIPSNTNPPGGTDAQVTIVDPNGVNSYDFFGFVNLGGGSYSATFVLNGATQNLLGTGAPTFDTSGNSCPFWAGSRAAGVNTQAGLVRAWELQQAGSIRHALALAFTAEQLSNSKVVWPAGCHDNGWSSNTGTIPYGQLLAIPATVNVNALGLSRYGIMIARALQKYGGYVVDRSSNGVIYGDPTISGSVSAAIANDLGTIRDQLRPILNNSFQTIGGGGLPIAPYAPDMCYMGTKLGGGKTIVWTITATNNSGAKHAPITIHH